MDELNMEYNSSRELLIMPEYGRNVQKLVEHAKTITDDKERQVLVEKIVDLMMQMNPQNKSMEDYREKLWKHLFKIGKYKIEVESPYGKPSPLDDQKKPDRVPYPQIDAKYRHYGHNVQKLIRQALAMPEGRKRATFVSVISSYMKLAYLTWNKEHYVSDDVIKADLLALSGGKLIMPEETSITNLASSSPMQTNKKKKRPGGHMGGNNGFKHKNKNKRKNPPKGL